VPDKRTIAIIEIVEEEQHRRISLMLITYITFETLKGMSARLTNF
jgi:hypothetical protein